MTDPYSDLYICTINFICGLFFFITYYGVLLIQKNKSKFFNYLTDIISILLLGGIYLLVIDSNKIDFHLYNIFFIVVGYLLGMIAFKNKLNDDYSIFFIIVKYIYYKLLIILKWSFEIIPLTMIKEKIKIIILKHKIKKIIKKLNKQTNNQDTIT